MFNQLNLLSAQTHQTHTITPQGLDFLKEVHFAPLAISEVAQFAKRLPVLISNEAQPEFMCVMALAGQDNVYFKQPKLTQHLPGYLQSYPFTMVNAKTEDKGEMMRAVAIDEASSWVSKGAVSVEEGQFLIFDGAQPSRFSQQKITRLRQFEQQRQQAKQLIAELKSKDLLVKRSIDVQIQGVKKRLLNDFYIVERAKLYQLPAETLASWAKKGWLHAIENHIDSVENIGFLIEATQA